MTLPRRRAAAPAVLDRPRLFILVAGLLLLATLIAGETVDGDSGPDIFSAAGRLGDRLAPLHWQFTAIVLGLAALHYAATAVTLRAASGLTLPFRENLLVQFAAAAANRVSAAGLGGSAVNARYLTRRGLPAAGAVGAVTGMAVLGGVADFLLLLVLVLAGRWLGFHGAAGEIGRLGHKLAAFASLAHSWWALAAGAALGLVGLVLAHRIGRRLRGAVHQFWSPVRQLLADPARLATLLVASAATTLVLALAFLASIAVVPGTHSVQLGAMLVAFMFGAAAGNAAPLPAGIGSTEAALTGVLVATGLPLSASIEVVLIFRVITFWAPPILGLFALRRLRRLAAI